jgi:hypothetical protein
MVFPSIMLHSDCHLPQFYYMTHSHMESYTILYFSHDVIYSVRVKVHAAIKKRNSHDAKAQLIRNSSRLDQSSVFTLLLLVDVGKKCHNVFLPFVQFGKIV